MIARGIEVWSQKTRAGCKKLHPRLPSKQKVLLSSSASSGKTKKQNKTKNPPPCSYFPSISKIARKENKVHVCHVGL
jgi:hypothetical protein